MASEMLPPQLRRAGKQSRYASPRRGSIGVNVAEDVKRGIFERQGGFDTDALNHSIFSDLLAAVMGPEIYVLPYRDGNCRNTP